MKQKYLILFSAVCLIFAACSKAPQESAEQTTQVRQEQAPKAYQPQITFVDAIKQGDEQAVKYYLAQEESPNQVDDNGTPLIVLAAAQDNIKIFQALLAANAFIDTTNANGENAFWTAVNNGNYDIADLLIILGTDVNTVNQDNMTPLMAASQNGYILNVEQLLKSGADISAKNKDNKTALDLATEQLNNTKDTDDVQTYKEIVSMLKAYGEPVIPAAVNAIAASDIDTFENLAPRIKNLPKEKQARLLWMAAGVCVPNAKQICHLDGKLKKTEFPCVKNLVCNKENNAQIIRTLLENGAPSDAFAIEDKNNLMPPLDADTISYRLQKANPELFVELMPELDTCMLSLTQISHPNPDEADDGLYATYWLKENCSLSKMNFLGVEFYEQKNRPTVSILPEKDFNDYISELGLSRDALIKKLGEPNFIEQKNASTEILTYREAKNLDKTNLINIVDYNYTLKHGVVINKDEKTLAYGLRPYVDREKIAQYETRRGY